MLQFVLFLVCILGTFNIPKYFEYKLYTDDKGKLDYVTTALNENKNYIVFCSWWNDLIVFGVIPFVSLVFFNLKIYWKVQSSDKMVRFIGRKKGSSNRSIDIPSQEFREASLQR